MGIRNFVETSFLALCTLLATAAGAQGLPEYDPAPPNMGEELMVHVSHVSAANPALDMALFNMACGARVNVLLCDEAALAVLNDRAVRPFELGKPAGVEVYTPEYVAGLDNLRRGLEQFTGARDMLLDAAQSPCAQPGECGVYVCLISLGKLYGLDIQDPDDLGLLLGYLDMKSAAMPGRPYRVDAPFSPGLFGILYTATSIIDF